MRITTYMRMSPAWRAQAELRALRPCACGAEAWHRGFVDEAVHCCACGALHYLGVTHPVAEWVITAGINAPESRGSR